MAKDKWYSGPPPSIGWWPASWAKFSQSIRWWNGHNWSIAVPSGLITSDDLINKRANTPAPVFAKDIEWQNRPKTWPERSRT